MVEEDPGEVVFLGEPGGEGLDAEGFGGVMAGVKDVQAEFLGEGVGPVGAFAGDEGIDPGGGGEFEVAPGSAGDDTDAAAEVRASGDELGRRAGGAGETLAQFLAGKAGATLQPDGLAVAGEEGGGLFQAEGGAELGIIAELGMGIERQVGTVDGEVVGDQEVQQFVILAGPGLAGIPEEAVVHKEQIGADIDGHLRGGEAGVHGGGDFGDGAGVLDLQTVGGPTVITDLGGAQEGVALFDEGGEGHRGDVFWKWRGHTGGSERLRRSFFTQATTAKTPMTMNFLAASKPTQRSLKKPSLAAMPPATSAAMP